MKKVFIYLFMLTSLLYPQTISLNGTWSFAIDSTRTLNIDNLTSAKWRDAKVPLSWQAQFSDLRDYQGVGWYKKTFDVKKNIDVVVLLKFGAVDYLSEIYVNKQLVGKHEGGYTPFTFDITKYLNDNENELVVRVLDPVDEDKPTEGIRYYNIPHGKQNWYVQTSGIWQDVTLEVRPNTYVKNVFITADISGNVDIKVVTNKNINTSYHIIIKDKDGIKVYDKSLTDLNSKIKINNPVLWHFDNPYLYELEITLGNDIIKEKFGFRSIEAKDGNLLLNGKPFYLIAALDQDFYPNTIYTTPSEEFIRDQMLKAKKLGLNMLRCHIKVPDPVYLKLADEIGLLVWYEVPNWDVFNNDAAARGSYTMDEMLERDWNHPSLIILSIINESWGIDLQQKDQREWLVKEFDRVKEKAVGRLVVDNSPCYGNFHMKTDINDYHIYYSIPENRKQFDNAVNEISNRAKWMFSEFGDSYETGKEPLILSEFGNWGLPILPKEKPFWFNRQFIDIDVSMPEGHLKRFNDYKLDQIFGTYEKLAEQSQILQANALKYEIETLRLSPQIKGYVVTEFTDINWEVNGLLDMQRNFKYNINVLPDIQKQTVIIPKTDKYTYWKNEQIKIDLYLSNYQDTLNDLQLKWKTPDGQKDELVIKNSSLEVEKISSISITPKDFSKAVKYKVEFELLNKGKLISKNYLEVYLYPEKFEINPSSVYTTNKIDSKTLNMLNDGTSVICFIDSTTKLPDEWKLQIKSRNSEWLDGNWATNMNWIRSEKLFNGASFSSIMEFEIAHTSPQFVVTGLSNDKSESALAGMFVGWIHMNSAYIVEAKVGKGNMILCGFPLLQNKDNEPYANALFANMIKYINSKEFNPSLKLK